MSSRHVVQLANRIRKFLPGIRFSVRRKAPGENAWAHTFFDQKSQKFVIEIDPILSESLACFILIHEAAHILSWGTSPPDVEHSSEYFDALEHLYTKVYEPFCAEE